MNVAVQKAVDVAGGQTALAKLVGGTVKQAHVWKWLRMERIPAERAIEIEQALDGRVTRQELRPDIFGEVDEATGFEVTRDGLRRDVVAAPARRQRKFGCKKAA